MTTLLIDTSSNKEIKVGIRKKAKEYLLKRKIGRRKAQAILPMIDKILQQQEVSLKDVSAIKVNVRRGSFTGIRVGMAISSALSFALKIPVEKI